MFKTMIFLASILISTLSIADNRIGVGLGNLYGGGLGARYTFDQESFRYFIGAGLLAYREGAGTAYGSDMGLEYRMGKTNNSIGVSYGTVGALLDSDEIFEYIGTSINYSYYFSGFERRSWVIGLNFYRGELRKFKTEKTGNSFHIGYQF